MERHAICHIENLSNGLDIRGMKTNLYKRDGEIGYRVSIGAPTVSNTKHHAECRKKRNIGKRNHFPCILGVESLGSPSRRELPCFYHNFFRYEMSSDDEVAVGKKRKVTVLSSDDDDSLGDMLFENRGSKQSDHPLITVTNDEEEEEDNPIPLVAPPNELSPDSATSQTAEVGGSVNSA